MENLKLKEKKEILNIASDFSDIVQERNWVLHYDKDSDSLALHIPHLSRNVRKKYVTDEVAFYITPQSHVEGIFIEYFTSNFVSHHKDFKQIIKDLTKTEKHGIVEVGKRTLRQIIPKLESVLVESLLESHTQKEQVAH